MDSVSYTNFTAFRTHLRERMRSAPDVRTETWQSVPADKPEMKTRELQFVSFQVPMWDHWTLPWLQQDIKPNLPWADDHFAERVGGEPLNPGVQWAHWPHAKSADRFRDDEGKFSHTYMERFWPKHADNENVRPNAGIRYAYGDLEDVVDLLAREPNTRQAYVPIFFPEDTGCHAGVRIPCTLGYHFMHREGRLHMAYYLRSCDVANHLNDDIYLAVRLLRWMCEQVNIRRLAADPTNQNVPSMKPGRYYMFVSSMHIFVNDFQAFMDGK